MKNKENKATIIGIQGGRGSFNEQALSNYVARHNVYNYMVKYLYTTPKVLQALEDNKIDYGQFAIHNSKGGIVSESIWAIANYKFQIVEEFAIEIRHYLMKRRDVDVKDIKTAMSHDQVFRQCIGNLKKRHPGLDLVIGGGNLVDQATAAKALANGKIDKNIAIVGPKILSSIYNLDIIDEDLQDDENNLTSFLIVKK